MGRLPCGHNDGWMIRLMDKGIRLKYCWGCIIDATGVKPIDFRIPAEEPKPNKKQKI